MSILFQLLERLISGLFDLLTALIARIEQLLFSDRSGSYPFQGFQAKFISGQLLLREKHQGFCLDGTRQIDIVHSFRNALAVGGTGVGKSSVVLIPSLLKMEGNFVVHDPSGELYKSCALDLKRRGYRVLILNFFDPQRSISYNPIQQVKSIAEANKLAAMLISHTVGDAKSDPFWNLQASSLLSLVIQLIKWEPEDRHHFRGIRHLVQHMSVYPDRFLRKLHEIDALALRREFEAFFQYDDKVKAGVIATVLSALHHFQDDAIHQVTAGQGIRLEQIRHGKVALFIQNPLADQRYYAALSSLFFEQLFATMLRWLPSKTDRDVFCLIDEAGVLHIPSLSDLIANVRKYRLGILLAVQDERQLVSQYGADQTQAIITNCFSKLYFAGQSLDTAKRIEELAGRFFRVDENRATSIRPLITRDEVRTLAKDKAILLAGNYNPMLLSLKPYYKNKKLLKRTQNPFTIHQS